MIKRTIEYIDYDGIERKEDFYFNLTKAEIMEMEMRANGMEKYIQAAIDAKNANILVDIFKKLIDESYGVKTADGRGFKKSPEILADFKSTEAYSELFMKLASDDVYAAEFVNGIFPANMKDDIEKMYKNAEKHSK